MKKLLFIIFALGAVLIAIILLFIPREKTHRRSHSSKENPVSNSEYGLEKDRQMLLGDWQNIVGDFNNAFNKIA